VGGGAPMTDVAERAIDSAPPNNNLAESITLGAMMLNADVAGDVAEIVHREDFYRPAHSTIFGAIAALTDRGAPADAGTVMAELDKTEDLVRVGGAPYLHTLVESVPFAANGMHYARQVAELATRRRIIEAAVKSIQAARGGGEVAEVCEQVQTSMYDATTDKRDRAIIISVGDLVEPTVQHIEDVAAGRIPKGIPTGWSDYDRMTGGSRPGQLIIPAGRTSMGKSVFTQNILVNCAGMVREPAILFSVEMDRQDMMTRLLCQIARVPLHTLIHGAITDEDRFRLRRAEEHILTMPLWLVDNVRTVPGIRAYVRRFSQRVTKPAMIGVDYLQRLSAPGRAERHEEVGAFADQLKDIAQDFSAAVIAPCQLNRGPETRATKNANVPKLSDLRESGNLEQTADVVALLFRPDYYDKASTRAGEADIIIAKNRNGPTDTVTVAAQLHLQKFCDMTTIGAPEPREWE
jgi:replicative DNA helicase